MVAIVGGEGLGLFNTSLNQLNGFGGSGSHRIGNGNDRAYVNAVTGNLVIQSQDDYLAALGLDVSLMRTYNSRGLLNNVNDDNQDLWQLSFYRRLSNLPATGVTTPITREGGDGHQAVFTYDTTKAHWIATDGSGAHDTLKRVGSEWIYEDTTNGVTEIYDAAGKLSKLRNRDGQLITLGYTGNLVTSLVDGSGQTTTLTYTGNNLTQITTTPSGGSAATRVRYAYDGSNRLTQVKVDLLNPNDTTADAAANTYVTTYEYSGTSKRISRITQSDGSELKIGYILVGTEYQIASLQQLHGYNGSTPLYRTTTFNYDTANRRTDVYDNLGAVTSYFYDTENRLTKVVSPQVENGLLSSVSYSYDAKDNITQVTTLIGSGDSRTVSYAYDANGNLTEIRDQLGNTVRRTYNSADQLASETVYLTPDPDGAGTGQPSNGLTTWYVYDAEQHLRYVISPEGRVTHNGYITNGLLATARVWTQEFYRPANPTDASEYTEDKLTAWATALVDKSKAERTDYTYNALGQLLTSTQHAALTTSGAGTGPASVTSYVYSRSGELLSKIDRSPTGTGTATTAYTYDGLGRLLIATDASGRTSATLYNDASSTVVVTSDQVNGGDYRLQTTSVFNKAGERISQTHASSSEEPLGTTLHFYDANGRMRMAQDPTGARVHYLYDARGRQVGQVNAEGELTETVYNGAGQVIRTIRYDGRVDVSTLVDGAGKPLPKTIEQIRGVAASPASRPVTDLNGASAGVHHTVTAIPGAALAPALTLSDTDSAQLAGATVTITNIQNVGSEALSINTTLAATYGITVTTAYNGAVGTLTLSGNASVANYQALLRTLQYLNSATSPNTSIARTVAISVTDGHSGSANAVTTVTINGAPAIDLNGSSSGTGYAVTYTENDAPTAIVAAGLTIADDGSTIASATAQITNIQNAGLETLSVDSTLAASYGISASYNSSTGLLTLTNSSSRTNYQALLRTLKYQNTSENPSTTARTVSVAVNDGVRASGPATATITVVAVNDAPVLDLNGAAAGTGYTASYTENGSAVAIVASGLSITEVDSSTLASASAQIANIQNAGLETLSIDSALATSYGITVNYNSGTGLLSLTGTSSVTNYQALLRTLKYRNTSENPNTTARTVNVAVHDGGLNSAPAAASITVVAVNDAPVLDLNGAAAGTGYTASYTENGAAVAIVASGLTITDVDNSTLASASAQIANLLNAGAEILSVDTALATSYGITVNYNNGAGLLSLTGTSSVTNYQALLRTLKYQNTSENPSTTARTVNVAVHDGGLNSAPATASITIVAVNDAPVLDLNGAAAGINYTATYTENAAAVAAVAAGLTITDGDSTTLVSASAQITNILNAGVETLSVDTALATSYGITVSYNSATGLLDLIGSASLANYQDVLRTLKYRNTSENPNTTARSITVSVSDGNLGSSPATATITVVAVNDAPVLDLNGSSSGTGFASTYTENGAAVAIVGSNLTITDVDGSVLAGATAQITNIQNAGLETLSIDSALAATHGIAFSFNSSTGVLSLSGSSSLANYQALLRTLKYQNTSENPNTTARTVTVSVSDGGLTSTARTATVTIVAVNDAPILDLNGAAAGINYTATYTENAAAVAAVASGLTIADVDSATLSSASAQISNIQNVGLETLSVDGALATSYGITVTYNSATGLLTLAGDSSVANYQAVLRTLKYQNASENPSTTARTVNVTVHDGGLNSVPASASITIIAVNDAPVLDLNGGGSGTGYAVAYTENDPATLIVDSAALSITDVDDSVLEGATAQILNPQAGGVESLSIEADFGISASFDAATGLLTLSGSSSIANYQAVLRSLRYANASDAPEPNRSSEIRVSDGESESIVAISQVTITPVNDAPIVDFNSQTAGVDHVIVMPNVGNNLIIGGLVEITDPDNTTLLTSARAEIVDVVFTAERLTIDTAHGIVADYWNGVMTLTGTATLSQYREVLSTLNYQRTLLGTVMLTDRTVQVTVNDGQADSLVSTITVLKRGSTLPSGSGMSGFSAMSMSGPDTGGGLMSLMAVTTPTIGASTNRITDYIYDAAGRLVYTLSDDTENVSGVETTKRTVVEMGYDGASRLIREVSYAKRLDPSVALTESAIKSVLAQSTYKNDAANRATRYFYTSDGQRQGTLDAEGYLTEQKYDAAGRLQEQIRYATPTATSPTTLRTTGTLDQLRPAPDAANDQATRHLYDARGQLVGSIDAMGYLTRYTYNTAGSLTEERRYAQAVVYDGSSGLTDYVEDATPASGLKAWIKAYAYDSLNRLVTLNESTLTDTTSAPLTRTTYEYNAVTGFLDRTTKAAELATTSLERRSTTFEYDALGRVLKEVGGEGSEIIRAAAGDAAAIASAYAAYGSQHEYDLAGRRIKTTEASGKVNLNFYDRDGRLRYTVSTGGTAGQGEVTETLYNAFGEAEAITQYAATISLSGLTGGTNFATVESRVASIVNPIKDRTTTLDYTLRGQLKQKTDAESHITRQIYNAFGQLASRKTAVQLSSVSAAVDRLDTWAYDRKGLLKTSVLNSGGGDQAIGQTLSYDAFGRIIEKKDGMNRVWKTGYDQLGRQVTTTDPLNNSTAPTTYDAFSRVLTQTDKLGQTTSYSYNTAAAGRSAVAVTTPEGVVTTTTYDRHGSQVKIELQNNGVTEISTWWYDRNGRLTSQIIDTGSGRLNLTTTSEYSKAGLLIGSLDANGIRTSYAYDAANRVMTRTVDPSSYPLPNGTTGTKTGALNLSTQYAYDAFGSVIKTTDAELVVTETIFDRKGQTVAVVVDTVQRTNKPAPLLLATVYSYDTEGRTLELKEGVQATRVSGVLTYSGAATRTTQYVYDKAGRRVEEVVDPDGQLQIATGYNYDKNNNLIIKVDANGNYWRYYYDKLNREVFSTDPLKGLTEKSYDEMGRVTRVVQYSTPLDTTPNNEAGIAGTAEASIRDAIAVEGFKKPDSDRATWYAYDNDGRQVYQVDALGYVTKNLYDKAGRVTETIRYALALANPGGLPEGISAADFDAPAANANDRKSYHVYDSAGRKIYDVDGLRFLTRFRYDDVGRVLEQRSYATPLGPSVVLTLAGIDAALAPELGFDKPALDRPTNYLYDAAGRITSTTDADGGKESYGYDKVGNRTSFVNKIGNQQPGNSAWVTGHTWTYEYDGAGRMIAENSPQVDYVLEGVNSQFALPDASLEGAVLWGADFSTVPPGSYLGTVNAAKGGFVMPSGSQGYYIAPHSYSTQSLPSSEFISFRSEVKVSQSEPPNSAEWLDIGAQSVTSGARLQARFQGDTLSIVSSAGAKYLGKVEKGATYVVEVMTGYLTNYVFVYEKGASRNDGFFVTQAGRIDNVRSYANGVGGETGHVISNMLEYKASGTVYGYDMGQGLVGKYYNTTNLSGSSEFRVDAFINFDWNSTGPLASTGQEDFSVRWTGAVEVENSGFYTFYVNGDDGYHLWVDGQRVLTMWRSQERFESQGGIELEAGRRYSIRLEYYQGQNDAGVSLSWSGPGISKQIIPAARLFQSADRSFNLSPVRLNETPTVVQGSLHTKLDYDLIGNLKSRVEAAGTAKQRTSLYEYDAAGRQRQTKVLSALVYDHTGGAGKRYRTDVVQDLVTTVTYDALGNAVANMDAGNERSSKVYDARGLLRFEIDANDHVTEYEYDGLGNQVRIIRYDQPATLSGQPIYTVQYMESILSAPGVNDRSIDKQYDQLGRVIKVEQPQVYVYDPLVTTGPQTFYARPTTVFDYNAFGQIIREANLENASRGAWNQTFSYYDKVGNKVAQIDPGKFLTEWTYENNGATVSSIEYAKELTTFSTSGYTLPTGSVTSQTTSPYTTPTWSAGDPAYRAHDAGQELVNQIANENRSYRVEYDRLGRIWKQTQIGVQNTSMVEGSGGALDFTVTRSDLTTTMLYDALGNVVSITDPQQASSYTYYDALGRIIAIVDKPSRRGVETSAQTVRPLTFFSYDAIGNIVREKRYSAGALSASASSYTANSEMPADEHVDRTYDAVGRLLSERNANGFTTFMSYDVYGNVKRVWTPYTDAEGGDRQFAKHYVYDAVGQMLQENEVDVTGDGLSTLVANQMEYDAFGQITRRGVSGIGDGWQEHYLYDAAGRVWKSTDKNGITKIYAYDMLGRVTAEYKSDTLQLQQAAQTQEYVESLSTNATNRVQKTVNIYDGLGRVKEQRLPGFYAGHVTDDLTDWVNPKILQLFDRWGNVTRITDADNRIQQFDYDSRNNLIRERGIQLSLTHAEHGANVSNATPTTLYAHDNMGRRIASINSLGYVNGMAYNAAGQVTAEYHADGGKTRYYYDALGHQTHKINQLGYYAYYTYDKENQLIKQFGPGSSEVFYQYDALGRRIVQSTWLYNAFDGDGLSTGGADVYAVQRQVINGHGHVTKDINPSGIAVNYAYDAAGRKTYEWNALSIFQIWARDEYGRVQNYRDLGNNWTTYTYNELGQVKTQVASVYGQDLLYSYDTAGNLSKISDAQHGTGAALRTIDYRYDVRGLRIREVERQGAEVKRELRMALNNAGNIQVLSEYRDGAIKLSSTYHYDLVGNRKYLSTTYWDFANNSKSLIYRYRYDAMDRLVISKGIRNSSGVIERGSGGVELRYDLAGNRYSEVSTEDNAVVSRVYAYDASDRLRVIHRNGVLEHYREHDRAGRITATYEYDNEGAIHRQRYTEYYLDGRVRTQRNANESNRYIQRLRFDHIADAGGAASYDAAGNLVRYSLENSEGGYYFNTYTYTYDLRSSYQKKIEKVVNSNGTTTVTHNYDANGQLIGIDDSRDHSKDRTLTVNATGQILYKSQGNLSAYYFYANGQQVGWFDKSGEKDLDFNYEPISDQYPSLTPGSYTTLEGDTLQRVALAVFGDSRLWYLIADANGLAGGSAALPSGIRLTIPNKVGNIRNAADTFKPYNPGELIGDTTPTTPPPPPPKKRCGGFLQVIVIVVAVVATVYTAGAAAGLMGVSGGVMSAGASALAGGAAVGGASMGLGTAVAAAAVGGAVGSVASQLTGMALGIQDGFSWRQVALGGLSAAATAGVAGGLSAVGLNPATSGASSGWAQQAGRGLVQGAINSAVGQGINIAMGVQDSFNWSAVAASAATSALGAGLGDSDPLNKIPGAGGGPMSFGRIAADAVKDTAYGVVNRRIQMALEGRGKLDVRSIAADAFGNALGNSIVGEMQFRDQKKNLGFAGSMTYDDAIKRGATPERALTMGQVADQQRVAQMAQELAGGGGIDFAGVPSSEESASIFTGRDYMVADSGQTQSDANLDRNIQDGYVKVEFGVRKSYESHLDTYDYGNGYDYPANEIQIRYGLVMAEAGVDLSANAKLAEEMSLSSWYHAVKSGGDWDFKGNTGLARQFGTDLMDEFGNFHFGVVANAKGFNLETSMFGGGAYQVLRQGGGNPLHLYAGSHLMKATAFGFLLPDDISRAATLAGFTWGDNPGDSINIMRGWDYYESTKP